ncbi:hypothetical protein NFI96_007555 [Prochilodus magdalenae]|nr:hypothetical protein NFI96_007555 [Prochilodus magdalenae]
MTPQKKMSVCMEPFLHSKVKEQWIRSGSTVKPSVSCCPPPLMCSCLGEFRLAALPAVWLLSTGGAGELGQWGSSEVKDGVLTSGEEEKNGRYSRSSTLTLSKARWDQGEEVIYILYSHCSIHPASEVHYSDCSLHQASDFHYNDYSIHPAEAILYSNFSLDHTSDILYSHCSIHPDSDFHYSDYSIHPAEAILYSNFSLDHTSDILYSHCSIHPDSDFHYSDYSIHPAEAILYSNFSLDHTSDILYSHCSIHPDSDFHYSDYSIHPAEAILYSNFSLDHTSDILYSHCSIHPASDFHYSYYISNIVTTCNYYVSSIMVDVVEVKILKISPALHIISVRGTDQEMRISDGTAQMSLELWEQPGLLLF